MDEREPTHDLITNIEQELGLSTGFWARLNELSDRDGWAYIVQLHALFEALLSQVLTKYLAKPELHEVFSFLDMGHSTYGKLRFAAKLGLLSKRQHKFLVKLGELRNTLVHDVRQTQFSLPDHIAALDRNGFRAFSDTIGFAAHEIWDAAAVDGYFRTTPGIPFFVSAYALLSDLFLLVIRAETARLRIELLKASMEKFLQETGSKPGIYSLLFGKGS